MKYNYVNIDSNQNISVVDDMGNKQKLDITNIYIDRNPFDLLIADPTTRTFHELSNIYMIEEGQIYVIGFSSKLRNITAAQSDAVKAELLNGWINFNDKVRKTGIFDVKSINKIKFNPNMFNQFSNGIFMSAKDKKLYKQTVENVLEYDRPQNEMHKLLYIKGVRDAMAFKTGHKEISALQTGFAAQHFYFSLMNYYSSGIRVGSLINMGEIKIDRFIY